MPSITKTFHFSGRRAVLDENDCLALMQQRLLITGWRKEKGDRCVYICGKKCASSYTNLKAHYFCGHYVMLSKKIRIKKGFVLFFFG
jgi:hypothetical protein